jgi:hypothetical protein
MTAETKNNVPEYEEEEINLLDYWRVIWKRRLFIVSLAVVVMVGTIVYSLSQPNIYQASAIITPVSAKEGGGGAGGAMSALALQFGGLPGIALPGSSSATEIVNLLKSNILREKILRRYQLMPILFYKQWDAGKKGWKQGGDSGVSLNPLSYVGKLMGAFSSGDSQKGQKKNGYGPDIWDGIRKLGGIVKINHNIKENSIAITAEYMDPETTARIVEYYLTTLTDHMSSEAKRVALINRKYLEGELGKTGDPLIKQKIYNMIAQQVETSMMAEVKENFSFKVIDPPKVPDTKIKPKRAQMVVLGLVVAVFIGIFLAFFLEYIQKTKNKTKEQVTT